MKGNGRVDIRELCRRAGVSRQHGIDTLKGAQVPHWQVGREYWIKRSEVKRYVGLLREVRKFVRYHSPTRLLAEPVRSPLAALLEDRVYFIKCGDFVKIGFGNNVEARLSQLQIGSPHVLEILHQQPGTRQDENEYHRRFAAYRHRAEWFRIEGTLADFLSSPSRRVPEKSRIDQIDFAETADVTSS